MLAFNSVTDLSSAIYLERWNIPTCNSNLWQLLCSSIVQSWDWTRWRRHREQRSTKLSTQSLYSTSLHELTKLEPSIHIAFYTLFSLHLKATTKSVPEIKVNIFIICFELDGIVSVTDKADAKMIQWRALAFSLKLCSLSLKDSNKNNLETNISIQTRLAFLLVFAVCSSLTQIVYFVNHFVYVIHLMMI